MHAYRIVQLGPHDSRLAAHVADLINDGLGQGACKPEKVLRGLNDADHGIFTIYATATDTLLGVATAQIFDDDGYARWRASKPVANLLPADPPSGQGRRIAYGDDLTVRSDTRGDGVGSALVRQVMDWLKSRQVTDFYAPLWTPQSLARAREIARRRDYTMIARIPDYWTEESIIEGWHCPRCGQPCHCDAYLMHTRLTPVPHHV